MDAWQLVVLLGAVVLVYALLLPRKASTAAQTNMMKEIEDTMEHFTMEIEEENKELIKLVADMIKEHEIQNSKLLGRLEALEKQVQQLVFESNKSIAPIAADVPVQAEAAQQQIAELDTKEKNSQTPDDADKSKGTQLPIKERYKPLFQLYDQGKSIEMIAKKLGMNKGEIGLIIQLAKREEQFRV